MTAEDLIDRIAHLHAEDASRALDRAREADASDEYNEPHVASTEAYTIALAPHGSLDETLNQLNLDEREREDVRKRIHQLARDAGLDPSYMDPLPYPRVADGDPQGDQPARQVLEDIGELRKRDLNTTEAVVYLAYDVYDWGLTQRELGEILGLRRSEISTYLSRARDQLDADT